MVLEVRKHWIGQRLARSPRLVVAAIIFIGAWAFRVRCSGVLLSWRSGWEGRPCGGSSRSTATGS